MKKIMYLISVVLLLPAISFALEAPTPDDSANIAGLPEIPQELRDLATKLNIPQALLDKSMRDPMPTNMTERFMISQWGDFFDRYFSGMYAENVWYGNINSRNGTMSSGRGGYYTFDVPNGKGYLWAYYVDVATQKGAWYIGYYSKFGFWIWPLNAINPDTAIHAFIWKGFDYDLP